MTAPPNRSEAGAEHTHVVEVDCRERGHQHYRHPEARTCADPKCELTTLREENKKLKRENKALVNAQEPYDFGA